MLYLITTELPHYAGNLKESTLVILNYLIMRRNLEFHFVIIVFPLERVGASLEFPKSIHKNLYDRGDGPKTNFCYLK
jgi:hypothetical protein